MSACTPYVNGSTTAIARIQPGEALLRINRTAREVEQRVQDAKQRARHERVAHPGHEHEHHADQGDRRRHDDDEELDQPHRVEGVGDTGEDRADGHEDCPREDRLDGTREIEAEYFQLELRDRA